MSHKKIMNNVILNVFFFFWEKPREIYVSHLEMHNRIHRNEVERAERSKRARLEREEREKNKKNKK